MKPIKPLPGLAPFHTQFQDVAERETRLAVLPFFQGGLLAGTYAIVEH